jgi:hypothetical protein
MLLMTLAQGSSLELLLLMKSHDAMTPKIVIVSRQGEACCELGKRHITLPLLPKLCARAAD